MAAKRKAKRKAGSKARKTPAGKAKARKTLKRKRPRSEPLWVRCPECARWLDSPGEAHICRPFREEDVVENLDDELREAWLKLRGFASGLGEQRIYASEKAVMFARKVCYLFVRPKKSYLEVVFFLPREIPSPVLKIVERTSRTKYAHTYRLRHADQVEEPLTDWIREAYRDCRAE